MMTIYGSMLSPFVRKVLVICTEKGLPYGLQPAGPGSAPTADFDRSSPFRRIPAITDGLYRLSDSSAIAQYIEAKSPTPVLIPADAEARGTVIWFDEFVDTLFMESVGKIFFNRVVAPLIGGRPDLDLASAIEADELPAHLRYLEDALAGKGGWLVDERFTLADIAIGSAFVNLSHAGVSIDGYPRLLKYITNVHARPSFFSLITEERRMLARRSSGHDGNPNA